MPECIAVVMDSYFFVTEPCDCLAHILNRFAHVCNDDITGFCIAQPSGHVRSYIRNDGARMGAIAGVNLTVMDCGNAVLDIVGLGETPPTNEFSNIT